MLDVNFNSRRSKSLLHGQLVVQFQAAQLVRPKIKVQIVAQVREAALRRQADVLRPDVERFVVVIALVVKLLVVQIVESTKESNESITTTVTLRPDLSAAATRTFPARAVNPVLTPTAPG